MVKRHVRKSWKSSLVGLSGALAIAWEPLMTGPLEWDRIAFAGLVAVLGVAAKW